ncbi:MAG: cyclic nucleotide-binding domain-containing protein [Termitinemataceae bacterium]|nr:MAG: cyclic nucleotide-binding domain-containing protein [Termitinemataceae bacterium]
MAQKPQLNVVSYGKGTYIIIEGKQDANRFFILREGQVQLSKQTEVVREDGFNTLKPGDVFGVVSAMSQHSQIESAQALTNVVAISVPLSEFEGLIQFNAPVAMKIIQQFSRRMRFLNDSLTQVTSHSRVQKEDSDLLYRNGEYFLKVGQPMMAIYAFKRYCECYPKGQFFGEANEKIQEFAEFNRPNFVIATAPFLQQYKKGNPIFIEGELGENLFIIQSGTVRIFKILDGSEVMLALLHQGDIFGEMALLESKPRSACAVASDDTILMTIQKQNFEGMASQQPQIISRLTKMLADRIWFSYKQLNNALIKDDAIRGFDTLLINLERNNIPVVAGRPYDFNFGMEEFLKMANIPTFSSKNVIKKMMDSKIFSIVKDKIHISNIEELSKICEYHRKMLMRSGKITSQ